MRRIAISFFAILLGCSLSAMAQNLEVGGMVGFGVQKGLSAHAATATASADTGFSSGPLGGVYFTDDMYERIGGEFSYKYQRSNLRVETGGQKATMSGRTHVVNYDFLFYNKPRESKMRFFFAVGAGIKTVGGTGLEPAFQPLSQYVLLTKKRELLGMVDAGGGVKWNLGSHATVRVEFRDYLTPAPRKVLVPAPGATISGWLNDLVPVIGVGYRF